jgi:hypothetical protein
LLIVVLFGFLNIKSVTIYTIPLYFFNNTIIVQVRYIIIERKEFARIGYNGFLFPHEYSGEGCIGYNGFLFPHEYSGEGVLDITGFFFRMSTQVKADKRVSFSA